MSERTDPASPVASDPTPGSSSLEREADGAATASGGLSKPPVVGGGDRPDDGPGAEPADRAAERLRPPVPRELEDTGLSAATVSDLLLKKLYRSGAATGRRLAEGLCLPFHVLDDLLLDLQQRYLLEVRGTEGHGRQGYVFDLTAEGRSRAREALDANRYVGPAPVPFDVYVEWVERQSVRGDAVSPTEIRRALDHLVLDEDFVDAIGAAVGAGSSIFLHGPPGNGKTAVARAIAGISGDPICVPRTVTVDGEAIIQIYDPVFHHRVPTDGSDAKEARSLVRDPPPHDQRFVLVNRPGVVVGGELNMKDLDLQHDEQAGVHRAPVQVKANGGVFVVDDFGRQRVRARDLLNRWMVPLESDVDYLTLPTGHQLPIPFDCLIVFATNLNPLDLVEEAFLRRLRYKIQAPNPTRDQYEEIFRRYCAGAGLEYVPEAVDLIYQEYYGRRGISPRAVHPRDLLNHVLDEARYRGEEPALDRDSVQRACRGYFLDLAEARPSPTGPDVHDGGA